MDNNIKDIITKETDKIDDWDKEDINVLYASLLSLQKALKEAEEKKIDLLLKDYKITTYVNFAELPSEKYKQVEDSKNYIWAVDKKGMALYSIGPLESWKIGPVADLKGK